VYDEINSDLMSTIHAGFSVDKYCWEAGWDTQVSVTIEAVTPAVAAPYPIVYTISGYGPWDVAVGLGVGKWRLEDSSTETFFLDSVPVELPDTGAGRSGSDGSLTAAVLTAASAAFVAGDVGRRIRIGNSLGGFNGLHEIVTYVGPTQVELDLDPTDTEASGTLEWQVVNWSTTVLATAPPATGAATLDYVCAEVLSCDFCKSNKVLITGTTSETLEDPMRQLFDRLEQTQPAHVELIQAVGVAPLASMLMTAEVVIP